MAQRPFDSEQPTSAMKYMTIPEKIELTPATSASGAVKVVPEPSNRYRPMKVPDKITLESATSAVLAPPTGVEEGGGGGPGVQVVGRRPHGGVTDAGRKPKVAVDPPPVDVQPAAHGVTPAAAPPAIPADFERRVKTLEQQVQRLTETIVRRDGTGSPRQGGNGFWYVLTFAGWMMVPLVVAFMYHYKKAQ